jgi:hypothetical protein
VTERDEPLEHALRSIPRPSAPDQFRARLRARFVAAASGDDARVVTLRPARRFPMVWPFALAASVALIVWFVVSRDRDLRWRVLDATGGGVVLIDGVQVPVAESARLQDLMQTVQELESPTGALRLLLRDELVIELGPGTHLSKMSFPSGGLYSMRVEKGSARVCTGADFRGNKLRVLSNDVEVICLGTVFAVDVEEKKYSCVCCLDGTVQCKPDGVKESKPVEAGKMCMAMYARTPAVWGDAHAPHMVPLHALETWARAHWKR